MNTEIREELQEQKSTLGNIPKHYFVNNESIAADYLNGLEDNIWSKIQAESKPKAASVNLWERFSSRAQLAIAASIAFVGFGIFTIINTQDEFNLSQDDMLCYLQNEDEFVDNIQKDSKQYVNLDSLTNDEIKKYIAENEGLDVKSI
jgi:hypothetical protein